MAKQDTFSFLKYARFALVFGLLLGLMLVVTACGGDEEEAAAPAAKGAEKEVPDADL